MSDIAQVYELHKRRICVLTFFPVEGAVHSGNCLCGPSWISANIPPGKAAGRRELKMVSTTSIQQKAESRKNKQSKVFFEKQKRRE